MRLCRVTTALAVLASTCLKPNAYSTLSDSTIRQRFPRSQSRDFDIHTGPILAPILIPRVPGTENSTKVLDHFVRFFQGELPEWNIEVQNSTSKTPTHGNEDVPFRNFIASRRPPWLSDGHVGYLTLVAHYDSKIEPVGFIGATDSAAPCAMIMSAVRSIDAAMTNKWQKMQETTDEFELEDSNALGLQVLFLDGEEAFHSWTATDSIYGARALADDWDTAMYPARSTYKTKLNSIDLFVLLDLLGSGESLPIPSWMQNTHWAYQHLAKLEHRLRKMGLFKSDNSQTWLPEKDKKNDAIFQQTMMQDDHIPFVARGVPALHLIPSRFPSQWHRIGDNAEYLDIPTVEDWSLLTAAFAAEYLELEGSFEQAPVVKRHEEL
ncbi:hypothetical protein LTS08_002580 [Lithohypha guttulata]|uniref:Peptide hydrolase n=1 Tax=Lithohypha guttulata TaxID=1690604 RepID=A0AAN7T6R8_9EURO|nr:hypothetical protein LTR05_000688 [Lithohypha guttulata]KAK5104689.1 hypothetical protein LTS08_002580 [Lithohypha guttulata]